MTLKTESVTWIFVVGFMADERDPTVGMNVLRDRVGREFPADSLVPTFDCNDSWRKIRAVLSLLPPKPVIACGHSRGGGLLRLKAKKFMRGEPLACLGVWDGVEWNDLRWLTLWRPFLKDQKFRVKSGTADHVIARRQLKTSPYGGRVVLSRRDRRRGVTLDQEIVPDGTHNTIDGMEHEPVLDYRRQL